MNELTAAGLADLAGVTEAEVRRMVDLGLLVAREGAGPYRETDVRKVRLAAACEQAGLPMDAIASAVRSGRLSFAFLESSTYGRWALRSARTYRQVSEESGVPLDTLAGVLEAMGFARMGPDERIREDELEVVPVLRLALSTGILDAVWLARIGRAYAEGMRLAANVENEAYRARFTGPVLASGADHRTAMELASRMAEDFLPLVDRTLAAIYRRQQELVWTEDMVEDIEAELERAGVLGRPERVPAMSFVDLVGFTRLTEERGDAAAAELAASLAVLVNRFSREHGGVPVKRLGDGVMVHFREPAGAVLSALRMVQHVPEAGLPPAHVGVAAGPVVAQGGDYFGRTVNLAARIAARADAGQVLVSGSVADSPPPHGVAFTEVGEVPLKGFAAPVRLLEARRLS
jgi:adenylate cyclase